MLIYEAFLIAGVCLRQEEASAMPEGAHQDVADPKAIVAYDDSTSLIAARPEHASNFATWIIALSMSLSYCLTYFWRYPIFVLPANITQQPVFSERMDVQACFSLAFILGFGLAKPFAATLWPATCADPCSCAPPSIAKPTVWWKNVRARLSTMQSAQPACCVRRTQG